MDAGSVSARNVLSGTVRSIEIGAVNAEIELEIAPGVTVVSIITTDAYGVIKASSVMVGVD